MTSLLMKDNTTGALFGNVCEVKGAGDKWITKKQLSNVEMLGRRNVCLKTDGEPALVAVQNKMIQGREGTTQPRNPPAYNPESNGAMEKGVQDGNGMLRTVRRALETRIKQSIDVSAPIMEWALPHACFLHTAFQVGHDGKTLWERLTGRRWGRPIVEFGEQVLGKLARQRMAKKVSAKNSTIKRKLHPKLVQGTWVGQILRTGENVIIGPSGRAMRVRTIKRRPEQFRWSAEAVLGVRATPRRPNPNNPTDEEVIVKHDDEVHAGAEEQPVPFVQAVDADMLNPEVSGPRDSAIRELKLTKRLFEKFGHTAGCDGCDRAVAGLPHRAHSDACRKRMYDLIADDEQERPALERAVARTMHRQDEAEAAPAAASSGPCPPAPPSPREVAARPEPPPTSDEMIDEPIDGEDSQSDDNEDPVVDGMEIAGESDEDIVDAVIPAPAAEGSREVADSCQATPVNASEAAAPAENRGYNDSTTGAGAEKRQRLAALQQILGLSRAERIIAEIESEMKEVKVPKNHRQRRTRHQLESKMHVAEVYSPPRMAAAAERHGLRPGWSLDITEVDPEDGQPWDLSKVEKQRKAWKLLTTDEPCMLVVSPMCGAFCSWMNINYEHMSEADARAKLTDALRHLSFAVSLCVEQAKAGRLFLFEHPVGASSWSTNIC